MLGNINGVRATIDEESWGEVVYYNDPTHYHIRYNKQSDGRLMRSYASEEAVKAHCDKFNGFYEEFRDGDKLTITRNGEIVQNGLQTEEGDTYSNYDKVICACLSKVLGEEFSGYEHNYTISAGEISPE